MNKFYQGGGTSICPNKKYEELEIASVNEDTTYATGFEELVLITWSCYLKLFIHSVTSPSKF